MTFCSVSYLSQILENLSENLKIIYCSTIFYSILYHFGISLKKSVLTISNLQSMFYFVSFRIWNLFRIRLHQFFYYTWIYLRPALTFWLSPPPPHRKWYSIFNIHIISFIELFPAVFWIRNRFFFCESGSTIRIQIIENVKDLL